MSAICTAIAVGICHIIDSAGEFEEVRQYVELAEATIGLDVQCMAAAMFIAQDLMSNGGLGWHVSLTIGFAFGPKLLWDERLFLGDVRDELCPKKYTLQQLLKVEAMAIKYVTTFGFSEIMRSIRLFRDTLLSVLLETPHLLPSAEKNQLLAYSEYKGVHVLIVEACPHAQSRHRSMFLALFPRATVKAVTCLAEATAHIDASEEDGIPVRLALISLDLGGAERGVGISGSMSFFSCLGASNCKSGLQVVSAIDPFESDTPALDMRSRPFMAMVTSDDTSRSQKRALFHRGVDAVFQTPLQSPMLAALVDFSHR